MVTIKVRYQNSNDLLQIEHAIIVRDTTNDGIRSIYYMLPNDTRPDDVKHIDSAENLIMVVNELKVQKDINYTNIDYTYYDSLGKDSK